MLRRASEEGVARHEVEKLKAELEELSSIFKEISIDRVVDSIRKDRETR